MNQEDLWRSFPTTATEFEAVFPDEVACRRYLVEVRWGGRPRCGKCLGCHVPHCCIVSGVGDCSVQLVEALTKPRVFALLLKACVQPSGHCGPVFAQKGRQIA